jgi:hypothetical protein
MLSRRPRYARAPAVETHVGGGLATLRFATRPTGVDAHAELGTNAVVESGHCELRRRRNGTGDTTRTRRNRNASANRHLPERDATARGAKRPEPLLSPPTLDPHGGYRRSRNHLATRSLGKLNGSAGRRRYSRLKPEERVSQWTKRRSHPGGNGGEVDRGGSNVGFPPVCRWLNAMSGIAIAIASTTRRTCRRDLRGGASPSDWLSELAGQPSRIHSAE